jgi:hypothetical protein
MIKLLEFAVKLFATGIGSLGVILFAFVSIILWDDIYFISAIDMVDQIWE